MSSFDPTAGSPLSRRSFLIGAGALAGVTIASRFGGTLLAQPKYNQNPFSLGVASGDPWPDGMVLWTRIATDPLGEHGLDPVDVPVRWQLASDENMKKIVKQGTVVATAALGHSVHIELTGLQPGRHYWYQFETGGVLSPVGRTRTMPALASRPDQLRFAFASCQHWARGYYAAYKHMADQDLDLVIHLGDYIYEGSHAKNSRNIVLPKAARPEIKTLQEYRWRYSLYKMDPDLQAAHANFPFIVTWDDHEVENNYANSIDENDSPPAEFLIRRAAAYQAYYENMPLRRTSMPKGPDMQLYRRLTFGDLAEFNVLDTRQYRSDQLPGKGSQPHGTAAVNDPSRVFMGGPQSEWLMSGLNKSQARWNVLAQQIIMAQFGRISEDGETYNMDSWDGYPAERGRLMDYLGTSKPRNPIILSGDSHSNLVSNLKADFDKAGSAIVGVEFAGTSISSGGSTEKAQQEVEANIAGQPHLKWFEGTKRGYVSCTIDRKQWRSDFMQVGDVMDAASPVKVGTSWVVNDGEPGVHRA
ncbi:alkaline phosphatase [bacterium]|nr:MAG: alkaline phosphatase [bacterium]